MEEAKYSFNVKFNIEGFDCQLTVRSDTTGNECIDLGTRAITVLKVKGAIPDRRWEAVKNGNNQPKEGNSAKSDARWSPPDLNASPTTQDEQYVHPQPRVCPICHQDDELDLIPTRYGRRFKCQRCDKWLPKALQPSEQELAEMDSK